MKMSAVLAMVILSIVNVNGQTGTNGSSPPSSAPALPAAGSQQPTTAVSSSSPGNDRQEETLARKYIELWNTGDAEQIKTFPAFVMHSLGGRVVVQPAILLSVITNWRKSMPDLKFQIQDTLVQGDEVAMRTSFRGTYKAHLFPFTPNPNPAAPDRIVHFEDMLIFKINDGRIAEIWEEYDVGRVQIQMGGKWCTDVMSSAAPPLDTAASAQAAPEPGAKPATSSKPTDPVER